MDSSLFFCHIQTSKNLDFGVKEPHLSQPKRRNDGGFRLDRSRSRRLLLKREAMPYFEIVLKSGSSRLKTVSPARIAGRCERRWSHRFIPHFFRLPGSRRTCSISLASPQAAEPVHNAAHPLRPLTTSLGQGVVLRNSGHTASTRRFRGGQGYGCHPVRKRATRGGTGATGAEPPGRGGLRNLHLRAHLR